MVLEFTFDKVVFVLLSIVQVPNQPDAYEFSIRTPVTPPRWKDFDVELEAAWDNIIKAFMEGEWAAFTQLVFRRPIACWLT